MNYIRPRIDLLNDYKSDEIRNAEERMEYKADHVKHVFHLYGIDIAVKEIVNREYGLCFRVEVEPGTAIKKIKELKLDLEVALAGYIEIVPDKDLCWTYYIIRKNDKRDFVGLKKIINSESFQNNESPLAIAAGIDMRGKEIVLDLLQDSHLLITGTTGSGKSVFIDDIILSVIYHTAPEDLKLILMDTKSVDLNVYEGIPHLLLPVIKTQKKALDIFLWLEDEMQKRLSLFASESVKNIDDYNEAILAKGKSKLNRILLIIDEYSDMINSAPDELNTVIERCVRLGRTVGVHLILATQLAVNSVVTPQIKANLNCRVSFTLFDKREEQVLNQYSGKAKLLGEGDMIISGSMAVPDIHGQAAYVSLKEISSIVEAVKNNIN